MKTRKRRKRKEYDESDFKMTRIMDFENTNFKIMPLKFKAKRNKKIINITGDENSSVYDLSIDCLKFKLLAKSKLNLLKISREENGVIFNTVDRVICVNQNRPLSLK